MDYRGIFRRSLLVGAIAWSIIPCIWAYNALPQPYEQQAKEFELARQYLNIHPFTKDEKEEIAAAGRTMAVALGSDKDPNLASAEDLAYYMEQRTVLDRNSSLRSRAWRETHERSLLILLQFLLLPLVGIVACYFIVPPLARWVITGSQR